MVTLVAAYLIVWLGVALYVARLGLAQRRLEGRVRDLQSRLEEANAIEPKLPRVA